MTRAFLMILSLQIGPALDANRELRKAHRTWTDSTGKFRVTARLLAVDNNNVRLETKDKRSFSVSLRKLDKASRDYAIRARALFATEAQLRSVLSTLLNNPGKDGRVDGDRLKELLAKSNEKLARTRIQLRYRVLSLEKRKKYYLMKLLPLHELNATPAGWRGRKPLVTYKPAVMLLQTELDVGKITPGRTIYQLSGRPTIFERGGNAFGWRTMGDPFVLALGIGVPERDWAFYSGGKLVAASK